MKRLICLLLTMVMLASSVSLAFAADRHGDRRNGHEQRHSHVQRHPREQRHPQVQRHSHEQRHAHEHRHFRKGDGPLKWGEHRRSFEGHRMARVHDRHLDSRYPGLHAYKWRGEGDRHRGFWHNGRYVNDGFMFFDRDDRMAGFGYLADGAFVFVDEDGHHENRDDLIFLMILLKLLDSLE